MDLSALFQCRTVAVVGASREPKKVGHEILKSLQLNIKLDLFPVNPHASSILGLKVYPSVKDLPVAVDVVIVCVPFIVVEQVIDEVITRGAKAVVIISAGFAETGALGTEIQARVVEKLAQAKILLLGPNTMGYIVPSHNLYVSFGAHEVREGNIALISQSGAMLSALFQEYASAHTGVSFAVSLGNRAGIDEYACLEYAEKDPHTKVIALYLESFRNIPQLLSLASRVVKTKPIFLLKGGTTERGVTAAVSHTAALATPQALLQDAARQGGVVMVETFEQFVRASIAASKVSFLPEHLMVITNAGGPAVVLVDEADKAKVPLTQLSPQTKERITNTFPHHHIANPLDLLGDADATMFDHALSAVAHDLNTDAVVCIVTQQAVTDVKKIVQVLAKPHGKRVIFACLIGGDQLEPYREELRKTGVLVTNYPNEVVETMQALTQARVCMEKTLPFPAHITSDQAQPYPENFIQLQKLLERYGMRFPRQILVNGEEDLEKLELLSYPLVAKTTDLTLKHKAKLGAVMLNIVNIEQARQAYTTLKKWNHPVVFQETVMEGAEALVGCSLDPQFGWYMAVGLGGSLSDAVGDRAYCFLPAQKRVIEHAIERTKLSTALSTVQKQYLADLLTKIQYCVLETQNLHELEINPLFLTQEGHCVADMKRG